MSCRLEVMNTHRSDLTKVRSSPDLNLVTATSGYSNNCMSAQRFHLSTKPRSRAKFRVGPATGELSSPSSRIHKSWIDFPATSHRPSSSTPSDTEDGSNCNDSYFVVIRSTDTPLTSHSTTSLILEDDIHPDTPLKSSSKGKERQIEEEEEQDADEEDEEKDNTTTTCTIIRPLPRSPIREFFSRTSSSIRAQPTTTAHRRRFISLGRFTRTDAFEEEVNHFQTQRAKKLSGSTDVRVWVTKTHEIYAEESWRQAVQELLYGNVGGKGPHIGPVIGRGD